MEECPCTVCGDAVELVVEEEDTGAPISDFVVEVIYNDRPSGEPGDCSVNARDGANSCSFGNDSGIYHVIVSAPGFETREALVRIAEEGSSEICCDRCLSQRNLTVGLTPVS